MAVDLRAEAESVDGALNRVERSLGVRLDRGTAVRKRRSVGARTDRGTWVRVERRALERIDGQGWNGIECAAALRGIAMPKWFAGTAWRDPDDAAMWRADETELISAAPMKPADRTALSDAWWATLNASLDALAAQKTTRVATPDTVTVTQASVDEVIRRAFPDATVDTSLNDWTAAHADLSWANLTTPACYLLDWEDWGMAPRGLDSAKLWASSLDVPEVAERVRHERRNDLGSQTGKLMSLFCCSKLVPYVDEGAPVRKEALRLLDELETVR
ncbi:hypothetical protein RKE29_03025 [Streptomyces sp. B1866]|uniref:hypothetical protein n=1 Tax=Streptomyces sp. B1866 TaxID=3075431 RepID=UPI00288EB3BE|nr:hypothetical protein [Streptomyces sp. B1866]MDT3395631.1 hypothetical protein [Streptomyces sp. B1866]